MSRCQTDGGAVAGRAGSRGGGRAAVWSCRLLHTLLRHQETAETPPGGAEKALHGRGAAPPGGKDQGDPLTW